MAQSNPFPMQATTVITADGCMPYRSQRPVFGARRLSGYVNHLRAEAQIPIGTIQIIRVPQISDEQPVLRIALLITSPIPGAWSVVLAAVAL